MDNELEYIYGKKGHSLCEGTIPAPAWRDGEKTHKPQSGSWSLG